MALDFGRLFSPTITSPEPGGTKLGGLAYLKDWFASGTEKAKSRVEDFFSPFVEAEEPMKSPLAPSQEVTPTPMATPTSIPTATPTPTPTPMPTPTLVPKYGRNPDSIAPEAQQATIAAIDKASSEFGVPRDLLFDIAWQESKYDPVRKAREHGFDGKTKDPKTGKVLPYSSSEGLFQINDDTWKDFKRWMGDLLPEDADRSDPLANARAAAFAIASGRLSKWNASKGVWGPFYDEEELKKKGFYDRS